MAKPPTRKHANLTVEDMRAGIPKLQRRIGDLEKFDPKQITEEFPPSLTALGTAIEQTLVAVFGKDTHEYNLYRGARDLHTSPISIGRRTPLPDVIAGYERGKARAIGLLQEAVRYFEEEIADRGDAHAPAQTTPTARSAIATRRIFVVHGHDELAKVEVARFVEQCGLEPVILHEQANSGRTLIEKFEINADVGFAIIILSPDDEGRARKPDGSPLRDRARQNVILELGYFIGKLGRDRVAPLHKGDVELPTDFSGVVYTPMDDRGAWKALIAREFRAANIEFNIEALMQ